MGQSENYLAGVRSGLVSLSEIPRKLKTHALCLAAVSRDGSQLYHVPTHFRSEAVVFSAIYKTPNAIRLLSNVEIFAAPKLLQLAVSRLASLFIWVVEEYGQLVDEELSRAAVKASGANLAYIPEHFVNEEMVLLASKNNGEALARAYVKGSHEVRAAIERCALALPLKHLPEHLRSYDACFTQVSQQGRQLRYVPSCHVDEGMVLAALGSNPWAIEYIPITFRDLTLVREIMLSGDVPEALFSHIDAEIEFV